MIVQYIFGTFNFFPYSLYHLQQLPLPDHLDIQQVNTQNQLTQGVLCNVVFIFNTSLFAFSDI